MTIITPDGPTATSQGGTVYVKRFGDFSRFVWAGECVYIGDITDERGGLNVSTRANALEGGVRRDGVLVDPPGNVSTTLSMKRIRGDKLKTVLRSCFWMFDKRTQCSAFDDPLNWVEIERVYQAKVGTRTTTPGTSIMDANAEEMVNFEVTALEDVDIYRTHIEEAAIEAGAPHLLKCVNACHGERCINCGNSETEAVLVAGSELVAAGTPMIYVNEAGGDVSSWTQVAVSEWTTGDVDGIVCLGTWGAAVSNTEGQVLYSRDRFTTRVVYDTVVADPNAIDASSQNFAVIAADSGYILISRDGCASVETSLAGTIVTDDLDGVKIAPSNRLIIYVYSSADDVIIKTENGGETWYQVTATGTAGGILSLAVHPDNADMVICGTDAGEIYETVDGGETWTEQGDLLGMTTKADVNIVDLAAGGGGVWYAGVVEPTVSSRVYVNYEDGASGAWEYYNPLDSEEFSTTTDILAISALGPNRLVAVGGDGAAADLVALLS